MPYATHTAHSLVELRLTCFLITGAAGFIGSHLVRHFSAQSNNRVAALDSLRYSRWPTTMAPNVKTLTVDLTQCSFSEMCEHLAGCDVLLHFAAEKHNNSKDLPQIVVDTNVSATLRLFEAAGHAGVKKVVFASSLYAYGRYFGSNMIEEEVPQPKTVYGITKLTGEGLARYIGDKYGVAVTIVRLFFVYGPRQYVGLGYPSVIVRNFMRILKGERPLIFGDGRQELDYVNVADVVAAIELLIGRETASDLFNISTGRGVSINHLTELMLEVAKSSLKPFHSEPDWTSGSRRVGDFGRLSSEIGWHPHVSMEAGLKEVYDWLQEKNSVL